MPRRRHSPHPQQQQQQQPLELTEFRGKVNEWLRDIYSDIDQKTAYLVKDPKGVYGQKVKGLIQHIYLQSPQVKFILGSRTIRANSVCLYIFHVFKFLSNYVIPPVAAVLAAYFYYYSEAAPVFVPEVVDMDDTNTTNTTDTDAEWNIDPVAAGTWTGNSLRTLLSVPLQFIAATVDRTLHMSEAVDSVQITTSRLFYTPLVGIGIYIMTHLLLQCFLNVQMLFSKQWILWNYQDLFLKETEQAIERSVTDMVKPQLIYALEQYLVNSSESKELVVSNRKSLEHIYHTYKDDVELLRLTLLEQACIAIRTVPLAQHLVNGQISEQYLKGIHMLIRHADEDLSVIMFQLNQEISRFPTDLRQVGWNAWNQIAHRLISH